MATINASSLFHFTDKICAIKGILEKGFRYSYNYEIFPQAISHNELNPKNPNFFTATPNFGNGVLLPIICFCDTPLMRTLSHSKVYGEYMIGINKDYARCTYEQFLNPVMYRTSSAISYAISDLSVMKASLKGKQIKGSYDVERSILQLIAITKPYNGNFRGIKNHCFFDEREWRMLMPYNYEESIKWYWGVSSNDDEVNKLRDKLNIELYKSEFAYVGLTEELDENVLLDFITHIFVKSESEIPEMVDFILNEKQPIFGYDNLSMRCRHLLVSKISSFERINKDF